MKYMKLYAPNPYIYEIKMCICSKQPCFGEARKGHCCGKPSHANGSQWTVRRKGKRKALVMCDNSCNPITPT